MHIDLSYDRTAHERFAAYETNWQDLLPESVKPWAGVFERAFGEDTEYRKQGRAEDNAYRNSALRQTGANAALTARTTLKAKKMEIDAAYRQFRERLNELEIPTLHLDAWYKQQQVGLAKANLALAASRPRNAFQYSTAMRQLDPSGMPASLAAIARNQPALAFEAQSGQPEAMTYDALAQQYGIGGAAPASATGQAASGVAGVPTGAAMGTPQLDAQRENAALAGIQQVAARGPQGQAPGTIESLTDYEREMFASGLEKLGFDYNDWIQRYERAGIGQGNVRAA